jgi:hypothetical protein
MKQTAVEWLEQQLYKAGWEQLNHEEKMNICCTAKMMEKEQIFDAYITSHISMMSADQYYYETFKQQENETNSI